MERGLRLQRGVQRVRGGFERRKKRVAHRLENVAGVPLDGRAHDRVVPRQREPHRLRVFLPKFRAALDIAE